jgi:hypothetical protein
LEVVFVVPTKRKTIMAGKQRPKGPRPSLTYEHLTAPTDDVRYSFEPNVYAAGGFPVEALAYTPVPVHPFNPEGFARDLDHYGPRVAVIADSSIYLAETDQ